VKYDEHPFIAIWETTQACDLACQHCRACARPFRDRGELTSYEGFKLLRAFGIAKVPLVVLTGGDPAKRPDLSELVYFGRSEGLNMGLTPSATALVTEELISDLASAGLQRLAISIDGPNAAVHDTFRGTSGSFAHSLRILEAARRHGIRTQVNTTVHAGSIARLGEIATLVSQLESILWSVFFVVPTGRADVRMLPSPEAVEVSLDQIAGIAEQAPFAVKTTAAPHYRRVLAERKTDGGSQVQYGVLGKRGERVNDGRGFMFVSHLGEIYPSGFLPVSCGNVRTSSPIDVYRNHPTFRLLRDADALTGKCRACVYRNLCGGSRARAYAMTGSFMAPDPLCAYMPPGYEEESGLRRRLDVLQ